MVFCAFLFFSTLIAFNGGEMRTVFLVITVALFLLYLALFHRIAEFSTARLINVKKKFAKSKKLQKNTKKQ